MAYFKKKRKAGPSKNELKLARARQADASERAAGTVRSNFPSVSKLGIDLTFLSEHGVVLGHEALSLAADDPTMFEAECPGMCGSGSFDFSAKVEQTVSAAQERAEGSAVCPVTLPSGKQCGCQAKVVITAQYK
jgi:hypothetical protein